MVLERFRGNVHVYVTMMGRDMERRMGNASQKKGDKTTA